LPRGLQTYRKIKTARIGKRGGESSRIFRERSKYIITRGVTAVRRKGTKKGKWSEPMHYSKKAVRKKLGKKKTMPSVRNQKSNNTGRAENARPPTAASHKDSPIYQPSKNEKESQETKKCFKEPHARCKHQRVNPRAELERKESSPVLGGREQINALAVKPVGVSMSQTLRNPRNRSLQQSGSPRP